MKDIKFVTLNNGLTIVFYNDKTKHSAILDLIIKFGGINTSYKYDGKYYKIPSGFAHFLEHLVIEHSMYGNMLPMFLDNNINFNGATYTKMTNFYIDTVHDFNRNLVKLLKGINTRVFNHEDVEVTKGAILEEIRENLDNKFRQLDKLTRECLFKEIDYQDILGTLEDIEKITYEDIKRCYEVFYKPSNQLIVVSGNFDEEKVLELIKDTYDSFQESKVKTEIPFVKEPLEVRKKEKVIKTITEEDYVRISYKIDISKLSSFDKIKLSFYMRYLLSYNFSSKSDFQKEILDKKISVYDTDNDFYFLKDFVILELGTYTSLKDEFISLVKKKIKNLEYDKEDFELCKKESLISIILRDENLNSMVFPLVDNIIAFDYYDYDKIEDINKETFEDYQDTMKGLDFSNYSITSIVKDK